MVAGYAAAAIALVAWPEKTTMTSATVVLITFAALIAGSLGWILIGERRLSGPFPRLPA